MIYNGNIVRNFMRTFLTMISNHSLRLNYRGKNIEMYVNNGNGIIGMDNLKKCQFGSTICAKHDEEVLRL